MPAVEPRGTPPSERTRVRRLPERSVYEREAIGAILDEALICHLAWVTGEGAPRVIPTIHARVGDTLYVHGSNASRALRAAKDGREVCIEVTLLDGLVFARSAFHHSMNYRSVIVYGRAREVTDPDEERIAQTALVDHVAEGRSADARMPNRSELDRTTFLAIDEPRPRSAPGHRRTTRTTSTSTCGPACCRCTSGPASPSPRPT
jgi:nitroimidazol reductase NimA-like FMN-containing flavoprotein (pyridoxamine 5'-phosphate oxidase superfamily)